MPNACSLSVLKISFSEYAYQICKFAIAQSIRLCSIDGPDNTVRGRETMKTERAQAIAIRVFNTNGIITNKAVIQCNEEQIAALASLNYCPGMELIPVVKDYDVFGKMYWTNRVND